MRTSFYLLSLLFCSFIASAQEVDTRYMQMDKMPYIQAVTSESATVFFGTDQEAVPAIYVGEDINFLEKVENSTDGLINAGGKWHRIQLSDLKPNTKYYYKANARQILQFTPYYTYYGDTINSKVHAFKTRSLESDTTRLIVFNDMHGNNEKLSKHISNQTFTPDFYIYNGDMVNDLQSEDDLFKEMLNAATRLFAADIPFYYARGNHETRGYFARRFYDYIGTPNDKPYYSITEGALHILMMDVGEDKTDDNRYYYGLADFAKYRRKQLEWLKKEIKTQAFKQAKYKILCVHIPFFKEENPDEPEADAYNLWADILKDAGIDLMISAHTHEYFYYPKETSPLGFPVIIPDNNQRTEVVVTNAGIEVKVIDEDNEIVRAFEI